MKNEPLVEDFKVCIVMAVHNGANHLVEQLESFRSQTVSPSWIVVSDDGSEDDTVKIIKDFFSTWDECQLILINGPRRNYAQNFISALGYVPPEANFVALSDQDDVWLQDKLSRAIDAVKAEPDVPFLYGAASWIWQPETNTTRLSWRANVELGFSHAVAQNFAGGNTMVINRAAYNLVKSALPQASGVPVHDWWLYQIISGAGGSVHYDEEPTLLYRQHQSNQIGANTGMRAVTSRGVQMLRGTYKTWNTANLDTLKRCEMLLSPRNRVLLDEIRIARTENLYRRFKIYSENMVLRHGFIGQAGLAISLLLNRF